jgi:hypothetical protein
MAIRPMSEYFPDCVRCGRPRCSSCIQWPINLRPVHFQGEVCGPGNWVRLVSSADGPLRADQTGHLDVTVELRPVAVYCDEALLAAKTGRVPGPLTTRAATGAESLRWQDRQPDSSAKKAKPSSGDRVEIVSR